MHAALRLGRHTMRFDPWQFRQDCVVLFLRRLRWSTGVVASSSVFRFGVEEASAADML